MTKNSVVITGASGLVGRALVADFLQRGFEVTGISRHEQSSQELTEVFGGRGDAKFYSCDLAQPGVTGNLLGAMIVDGRDCNFLVHSARSIDNLSTGEGGDEWAQLVDEFTLGVVAGHELVSAIANNPQFELRAVVNVSSVYSFIAVNPKLYQTADQVPPLAYSVAKAAMNGLTRELAVRLGPKIRVNGVAFGGIEGRASTTFAENYANASGVGRMLSVDEVASPIRFLLSPDSSGITGHTLVVDAGWSLT